MEEFMSTLGQQLYTRIEQLDKPVIAMINGVCFGGGLELALACDIRIASSSSNIRFIRDTPWHHTWWRWYSTALPVLVGMGKAKELIFTGNMIDAEEAFRIGLINQVAPAEKLEEIVASMARRIAEQSPLTIKWAKKSINVGLETAQSVGLSYEALAECLLFYSKDREEGMKAFLEKRKPQFKGE